MYIKKIIPTITILGCCFSTVSAELIREEPDKHFSAHVSHVESLTYIDSDNSLWQANDSRWTTAGQDPDNPVILTQTMNERENFYGASGLGTTSLNWRELETIGSDGSNVLYVVNTVNIPTLCGNDIVDEPTLYKLQRSNGSGDFSIVDWHLLPNATRCTDREEPFQSSYSGMVVIDGLIYFAHKREIRLYDYDGQRFASPTAELSIPRSLPTIRDLAYDGTYLWILGYFNGGENPADHWLTKVDWAQRRIVESQNLESFNLTAARALAVNGSTLYIGENRKTEKNIHVATINAPITDSPITYLLPHNEWHQIGLPYDPGVNNTVENILGDDGLGTYGIDWVIFSYNASSNSYVQLALTDSLNQGVGYWIIQTTGSDKTLDMPVASTPVTDVAGCLTNKCFDISLGTQAGSEQWNMIGYPFAKKASFNTTRVGTRTPLCSSGCAIDAAESNDIFHNQLWHYDGSGYNIVDAGDNLEPWKAYWAVTLNNANDNVPSLLIPKPE